MPTTASVRSEPAVLPFNPAQGWSTASPLRRSLVLATVAFALLWLLLLLYRWPAGEADFPAWYNVVVALLTVIVFLGGPFGCYATARVLRPQPEVVSTSRRQRHMLAALCTAYGLALLSMVVTPLERGVPLYSFGTFWLYLLFVLPLTPVTLAWGVASAIARHGRTSP